jgi:hypothetical protein
MTPASRNWFFGTGYLFYALPPTSFMARNAFYPSTFTTWQFGLGLLCAALLGMLAVRWGIARGEWLGKLKR